MKIRPPKGYRLLRKNERVEDGDMYFAKSSPGWTPTINIGKSIYNCPTGLILGLARKIKER